jgi:hypothetical protein
MKGTTKTSIYFEQLLKRLFKRDNMLTILFFIIGFILYISIFSPIVEKYISQYVLENLKYNREITLNYLTPIYSNAVYAQDYQLNTLGSVDLLKEIKSKSNIQTTDVRIVAMEKFLLDYNSPMAPYASVFIQEADRYGLDWRLVASISGVESAFGNLIPLQTNNGWGWRGGPGGDWSKFATWGDGVKEVTRGLAQGYGVTLTPFQIEPTYCPPCGRNPAHSWANGVTRFMRELDNYTKNLDKL